MLIMSSLKFNDDSFLVIWNNLVLSIFGKSISLVGLYNSLKGLLESQPKAMFLYQNSWQGFVMLEISGQYMTYVALAFFKFHVSLLEF